jgi:hypothetical protein
MKRIAFLTVLGLTASAAAFASPVRVADKDEPRVEIRDRDNGQWTRDRYDRYDRSHWARDFRGRWTPLARGYSAQSSRQFITVRGGRYDKLRVEAVRGEPVIQKIAIEFRDGSSQAVDLDMRLSRGTGEVIDLNGRDRQINRIIVYTDPHSRGAYTVYGA